MYLFKTLLTAFFAVCYLRFAHCPDVQQGSLGLPCHVTWSISCHESAAWHRGIMSLQSLLCQKKEYLCPADGAELQRGSASQWPVQTVVWDPAADTHAQGVRLMNIPGHLKDTWEQSKLPLESLSCVANNFRGPKVINYILHSEASAFPALLHTTVPTSPWIQAH